MSITVPPPLGAIDASSPNPLHHHPPPPMPAAPPPVVSSQTTRFLQLLHLQLFCEAVTTATLSRMNGPCACGGCTLSNVAALLAACRPLKWRSSCLFSHPQATKLTAVPLPTSREPLINSSRCTRAEEYKCFSPQTGLMGVMKH